MSDPGRPDSGPHKEGPGARGSKHGGRGRENKVRNENKNYIVAGVQQLKDMFGSKADEKTIKTVYDEANHDLWKAIRKLHDITGLTPPGSGLGEMESDDSKNSAGKGATGSEGSEGEGKKGLVEELKGDLFSVGDTVSLAHCVSRCLAMGKGIAVLFKKTFGREDALKAQDKQIGDVAILDDSGKRYVYYLITKERYFHKPTYGSLEASLTVMCQHAVKNKVTAIAMPRIGCGLDGLLWPQVRAILEKVFKDSGIAIKVFSL